MVNAQSLQQIISLMDAGRLIQRLLNNDPIKVSFCHASAKTLEALISKKTELFSG